MVEAAAREPGCLGLIGSLVCIASCYNSNLKLFDVLLKKPMPHRYAECELSAIVDFLHSDTNKTESILSVANACLS